MASGICVVGAVVFQGVAMVGYVKDWVRLDQFASKIALLLWPLAYLLR